MHSVTPLIEEIERTIAEAIKYFNLSTKPEQIVVTVQSHGTRRNALGWFAGERWQNGTKGASASHEINITAEFLKRDDDRGGVAETILHELAHAENKTLKIADTDKSGRVHNKKFKEMAERLGLSVDGRDPRIGFSFTRLNDSGKDFLKKCAFKRELFKLYRVNPLVEKKDGTRMIKCECASCGYVVRTTKKWLEKGNPFCPCGTEMKPQEQEDVE